MSNRQIVKSSNRQIVKSSSINLTFLRPSAWLLFLLTCCFFFAAAPSAYGQVLSNLEWQVLEKFWLYPSELLVNQNEPLVIERSELDYQFLQFYANVKNTSAGPEVPPGIHLFTQASIHVQVERFNNISGLPYWEAYQTYVGSPIILGPGQTHPVFVATFFLEDPASGTPGLPPNGKYKLTPRVNGAETDSPTPPANNLANPDSVDHTALIVVIKD